MPKVTVDGIEVEVEAGSTVLQACEAAGKEIPRFCYHERLSIAGNCRMCLVEMEKSPKPVASCAMPVMDGQVIKTNTPMVKKAREGVMEFLLINHPLDCPICDQGGECDLQDQAFNYGGGRSRYELNKRSVDQKYMGPLIKTHMNRCIHCTRCVRFSEEVAGVSEIGAINRGENMEITTFLENTIESEMSGNVIDLCPVGALTSKPYSYEARPWELNKVETIDVMDAVGSNIRMDSKGWEVKRVLPRINDEINEEWISDKTRYACDGLLNNRIDAPYIKKDGEFKEVSWKEALSFINQNLENKKTFGGLVGQLVDLETSYAFKKLFNNVFNSELVDFRQKDILFDTSNTFNFKFNTTISKIDEADFILLVGANPRLEATIISSRIRKAVKSGCKVFSIGDPGDQHYKFKVIGNNISILDDLVFGNISESKLLKEAKNPVIIIGESVLKSEISKNVISSVQTLLKDINKLDSFNILHQSASNVGSLILGLQTENLQKVYDADVLYLLNADEVNIDKKNNQFIIYQGSHGGENSKIADVILPGAAYSEKNGSFVNLEGRVQRSYKASYPPGFAKEDFEIFNDIAKSKGSNHHYVSFESLREEMISEHKSLGVYDEIQPSDIENLKIERHVKKDHLIEINNIDYYQTNIVARSSQTMNECKLAKQQPRKTGTEN
ncbi:NADH-quinone oxidoreductase subunit NuoG [Candidatus Pelagibacter sp. HIMB1517]|uniref:NADH-quinone oxidoreductase subunit NuoG n=1 Tax=Candidatus Pelagibacter sp. HIMB1517 TaxID=3413341 RepID=UPI003F84E203